MSSSCGSRGKHGEATKRPEPSQYKLKGGGELTVLGGSNGPAVTGWRTTGPRMNAGNRIRCLAAARIRSLSVFESEYFARRSRAERTPLHD